MADKRDEYKRKTPPVGVQAQLAHSSGVPKDAWDEPKTGVMTMRTREETPTDTILRRTADAKNLTIDTLRGVETLRRETREDIKTVNARIDHCNDKMDAIVEVVNDIRIDIAGSARQNEIIIKMLDDQNRQREQSGMMKLTTMTAEVEVKKTRALSEIEIERTGKLADIEATAEARKLKRDIIKKFSFKLIAWLAAFGAAALAGGYIFTNCT